MFFLSNLRINNPNNVHKFLVLLTSWTSVPYLSVIWLYLLFYSSLMILLFISLYFYIDY